MSEAFSPIFIWWVRGSFTSPWYPVVTSANGSYLPEKHQGQEYKQVEYRVEPDGTLTKIRERQA